MNTELDIRLRVLQRRSQLLPALTPQNGRPERRRLADALRRGHRARPAFERTPRPVPAAAWTELREAERQCAEAAAGELYRARLEEIRLDLEILDALGQPKRVRPLARRRFGTGSLPVDTECGPTTVRRVADAILATVEDDAEPRLLAAQAPEGQPSLSRLLRVVARRAGIEIEVRVEPRLTAGAAVGERTVFIADRTFGEREAIRLAAHEVLGHLVAQANGRGQPLRIWELGTAGSFADQEGLALCLEEDAGVLDGYRLRTLAGRVVATDALHDGASFEDTARLLLEEHGFGPADVIALCERAYRGGGVARDAAYLFGWLRVRHALAVSKASIDGLRAGRIGLRDLAALRRLKDQGLYRPAVFRPSLSYSLGTTEGGTSLLTSPPRVAASLTMLELT